MNPYFKLFSRCYACRKRKIIVMKRRIRLPIGQFATSKDLICGSCFRELQGKFKQ